MCRKRRGQREESLEAALPSFRYFLCFFISVLLFSTSPPPGKMHTLFPRPLFLHLPNRKYAGTIFTTRIPFYILLWEDAVSIAENVASRRPVCKLTDTSRLSPSKRRCRRNLDRVQSCLLGRPMCVNEACISRTAPCTDFVFVLGEHSLVDIYLAPRINALFLEHLFEVNGCS